VPIPDTPSTTMRRARPAATARWICWPACGCRSCPTGRRGGATAKPCTPSEKWRRAIYQRRGVLTCDALKSFFAFGKALKRKARLSALGGAKCDIPKMLSFNRYAASAHNTRQNISLKPYTSLSIVTIVRRGPFKYWLWSVWSYEEDLHKLIRTL